MTVLFGIVISGSGLVLDFPIFGQGRELLAGALVVHGLLAVVFIAASLGHIYIGTLGMEGAWAAMGNGMVDENWAREHHGLWVAEVKGEAPPPDHDGDGGSKVAAGDAKPQTA